MPQSLGQRAPLLWLVLPFAAGLAVEKARDLAPLPWLFAGAATGTVLALVALRRGDRGWSVALMVTLFFAGAASYTLHRARLPAWDHLPPREATVTVRIDRVFAPKFPNRVSALATVTATSEPLRELAGQRVYCGFTIGKNEAPPLRSAEVEIIGVIETLPRNPPANTFDGYLANAGLNFRLTRGRLLREVRAAGAYPRFRARAEERFKKILGTGVADRQPALTAVLRAMMLGEKQELSDEQDALFMQSGTMHLFAISGLHIGVIALSLQLLLGLLRLPRLVAFSACLVALSLYVDITGAAPSAVRALLMVALWRAAALLRLPDNSLAALTTSALVVLLIAPMQLFSASFQMSYAILAALLLLGRPLAEHWQASWQPFRHLPEVTWSKAQRAITAGWRWLATIVAFGVASSLVSTVTGVLFFGLFTPGALVANLVCIPTAMVIIVGGFASLVSGLLGVAAWSALFNHAALTLLTLLDGAIRLWVKAPGVWQSAAFAEPWIGNVALAGLLLALLWGYATDWRWRRGGWLPPFVVAGLALALGVTFAPPAPPPAPAPKKPVRRPAKMVQVAPMKSAYELAMERLAKSDPDAGKPLTTEQKARLAEIDRLYKGKLAEREIFLKKQLNDVLADGKADEAEKVQQQLVSERARLEEERDGEKERVRRNG
ncbi:ComEC/Rec2 family competence protein [Horticoccus luteus]|uniref:ComEC/Rec2 family competence protein n=1 Tax=Horticoccus luteus TaxID=2862869 RepID=A0A8F9TSL0_9BACT|nr:ComEC/Rec2 family competence protein [Horticoccus luteus]QYM78286.1 ComEC/Rec2 family competence protein [Horticoccus luteus]